MGPPITNIRIETSQKIRTPDSIPNVIDIFSYNYLSSGIELSSDLQLTVQWIEPSSDKKHLTFHLHSVIQKEWEKFSWVLDFT